MGKAAMALVLAVVAVGMAACGGSDNEPQPLALELTSAPDGTFAISEPDPVKAGLVRVEYQNSTEDQADAQLLRIDDGHSVEDALAVLNDDTTPDWLHAAGGAGQIAPGATGVAEIVLDEGTYYLVDVGEPEGDQVPSHADSGATAAIEVAEGDDDAELPEVDASIEMAEYNFLPEGLKAGANRFLLSNTGKEIHHTLISRSTGKRRSRTSTTSSPLKATRAAHRRSSSRRSPGRRRSTAGKSRSPS